jgi:hypothetical protein
LAKRNGNKKVRPLAVVSKKNVTGNFIFQVQLCALTALPLPMPPKATEEYRIALMSLLSQLSELERLGNDFFGKM